jgi:predicted extracellular nuclease
MFAYNPTPDRSAEILTNASNQAAEIQMQGYQSLGNSLAAMGNSFADSINKAKENASKAETNLGTGEAIASIYQTYGTPEQYQDYIAGLDRNSKNQDKLAGYNAVHVQTANSLIEMDKSKQIAAAQVEGYKDLADYKSSVGPGTDTTATPSKLDSNYARQFYQGLRENGRSHEQALADMDSAGLNWGKPYIEGQKNPFFP